MRRTRGKTAKRMLSSEPKQGRWSNQEIDNPRYAFKNCGLGASPKELAAYVPSRNNDQIRKYLERLKSGGEYNSFIESIKDFFDVENESVGGNHIHAGLDFGIKRKNLCEMVEESNRIES